MFRDGLGGAGYKYDLDIMKYELAPQAILDYIWRVMLE